MNISPDILARVIALNFDQPTMTAVLQIIADATDKPIRKGVPSKAYRLAADWSLPDEMRDYAGELGLSGAEISQEAEKMRNWSISSPKGAKMDWFATWKNWILAYMERTNRGPNGHTPRPKATALATLQAIANGDEANDLFAASRTSGPVRTTIEGSVVPFPQRA